MPGKECDLVDDVTLKPATGTPQAAPSSGVACQGQVYESDDGQVVTVATVSSQPATWLTMFTSLLLHIYSFSICWSAVDEECSPSFSSSRVTSTCSGPSRKAETPRAPAVSRSVRANRRKVEAWLPFVHPAASP